MFYRAFRFVASVLLRLFFRLEPPVDPQLALQAEGEGVAVADLDPTRIAAVRTQLPALTHRRCQPSDPVELIRAG